ncbi:MAG: type II toxin-antitoxin system PemK/MazF family toxin [Candidatus Binatia bacterium]
MTFDSFDVVVVPFPFSERPGTKRRPALVLTRRSFNDRARHTALAMITTKADPPWPGDTALADFAAAGLARPCVIRLKLFTLDNRLIVRKLGALARSDRGSVAAVLRAHVGALSTGTGSGSRRSRRA